MRLIRLVPPVGFGALPTDVMFQVVPVSVPEYVTLPPEVGYVTVLDARMFGCIGVSEPCSTASAWAIPASARS